MAEDRSVILMCREASKDIINKVFEAVRGLDKNGENDQSLGPNNVNQRAVALGTNPEGAVVGRFSHGFYTEADAIVLSNMKMGMMPAIAGAWGEDGLPSEQNAIAAFTDDFEISVKPGSTMSPTDHLAGMLTGMGWEPLVIE